MKTKILLSIFLFSLVAVNAQLIKRDFLSGYTGGQALEKDAYTSTTQGTSNPIKLNQWNLSGASNQAASNPLVTDALFYTGYVESGVDVAIDMPQAPSGQSRTSVYSLDNASLYGAGTYYLSFMMNLTYAGVTGLEFLSFDGNYTGNAQRGRLTAKATFEASPNYVLGLGNSGAASTFGTTELNLTQTYLLVLKVTIDGAGLGTAWLYVNPDVTAAEPTSHYATVDITGTALANIRGLVIRQRATIAAQIGGFRFANSWASVLNQTTSNFANISDDKYIKVVSKNIITNAAGVISVYNLTGKKVFGSQTSGQLQTDLPKGLYLVQFTDNTGATSKAKVIID